jgi:hypothetical protein
LLGAPLPLLLQLLGGVSFPDDDDEEEEHG